MKALFLTALLLPVAALAQDDTARLRDALKSLTSQLRAAQAETAEAQASAIAAGQKAKSLEAKVAELEKKNAALARELNDYKAETDKRTAALNNRLAEREKRLADHIVALDKWKAAYHAAADSARKSEDERARLATEAVTLRNTVADRERKNIRLFNAATEILDRYEAFSLGKSLAAKEPFIGNARVRIENEVQGYRDRILDQRLAAPAKP